MCTTMPQSLFRAISAILSLTLIFTACAAPATGPATSSVRYLLMDPVADSDKPQPVPTDDNSCYLHTAANLLAAAGYRDEATVQERADAIFGELEAHFGTANGGWAPTAVNWWLQSSHNTWQATNSYTLITVLGGAQKVPWTNANGAMELANHLRALEPTGLSISWPATDPDDRGGHAITAWGDDETDFQPLTANTTDVIVSDSDRDTADGTHTYNYDAFTNPNPGGMSHGNGWYLDYSANHPFIKAIHVLSAPGPTLNAVRVLGSYRVLQSAETPATDLHFRAATDTEIVTYRTWTDRPDQSIRNIKLEPGRQSILVDIDLPEGVPQGTWVTISTEFVLSRWNQMRYEDVHFTYPGDAEAVESLGAIPTIEWTVDTPIIMGVDEIVPNAIGGYLIAGFDLVDPRVGEKSGEYRLVHQYLYDQDPGTHTLSLAGSPGLQVTNIRWGHAYGLPSEEEIWQHDEFWLGGDGGTYELGDQPIEFVIRLDLPYPAGDGPIPDDVQRGPMP